MGLSSAPSLLQLFAEHMLQNNQPPMLSPIIVNTPPFVDRIRSNPFVTDTLASVFGGVPPVQAALGRLGPSVSAFVQRADPDTIFINRDFSSSPASSRRIMLHETAHVAHNQGTIPEVARAILSRRDELLNSVKERQRTFLQQHEKAVNAAFKAGKMPPPFDPPSELVISDAASAALENEHENVARAFEKAQQIIDEARTKEEVQHHLNDFPGAEFALDFILSAPVFANHPLRRIRGVETRTPQLLEDLSPDQRRAAIRIIGGNR